MLIYVSRHWLPLVYARYPKQKHRKPPKNFKIKQVLGPVLARAICRYLNHVKIVDVDVS